MEYKKISEIKKGVWLAKNSAARFVFVNEKGEWLAGVYDYIGEFKDEWAVFLQYHQCGFINKDLKEMNHRGFCLVRDFQGGLALVGIWSEAIDDRLYYYVNPNGDLVLGPYFYAESFTNGTAQVRIALDGEKLKISTKGELINTK